MNLEPEVIAALERAMTRRRLGGTGLTVRLREQKAPDFIGDGLPSSFAPLFESVAISAVLAGRTLNAFMSEVPARMAMRRVTPASVSIAVRKVARVDEPCRLTGIGDPELFGGEVSAMARLRVGFAGDDAQLDWASPESWRSRQLRTDHGTDWLILRSPHVMATKAVALAALAADLALVERCLREQARYIREYHRALKPTVDTLVAKHWSQFQMLKLDGWDSASADAVWASIRKALPALLAPDDTL